MGGGGVWGGGGFGWMRGAIWPNVSLKKLTSSLTSGSEISVNGSTNGIF